jgi:heat shock protein HtpX
LVGALFGLVALFPDLKRTPWLLVIIIFLLMNVHQSLQSLVGQFMEVRADRLGSEYVPGGSGQMAEALRLLSDNQEKDSQAAASYLAGQPRKQEEENTGAEAVKRDPWLLRLLEFQYMTHPPVYWRIGSLANDPGGWSRQAVKDWLATRWKESLP